ncbi:MAG: diacylglycerol kinase family lipid kinase [Candidatus Kaiserbacteria bacterium]|nr:diacylglycerol kinase family lipid kinase [Candidatus Kaiserbacteria bacterium]
MPKIAIIANERSGGTVCAAWLKKAEGGMTDYSIYRIGEHSIDEIIREAHQAGCRTIVAAGGDGTISSVAGAIVRSGLDLRLAVLPLGTFNHFAKDLGIPLDPTAALEIAKSGETRMIDVARVNGVIFINNSSIGAYPLAIRERDAYVERGWRKIPATVITFLRMLRTPSPIALAIEKESGRVEKHTPFVLIGNNRYSLSGFSLGARARLDEGTLFIAFVQASARLSIARLLYKALLDRALEEKELDVIGLRSCSIETKPRRIHVSHDGEVSYLTSPLQYEIMPRTLAVASPK